MRNRNPELSPWISEFIAGSTAGAAATLVSHPLDIVKTRLQLERRETSKRGHSLGIVRDIFRDGSALSGFYRGLTPNLIGNTCSWALYFTFYGAIKQILSQKQDSKRLSPGEYFLASGAAGVVTALFTNPIWVVKTRMLSTSSSHPGAYKSIIDGFIQIQSKEGFRGFYRGLVPSLFGVSHGAVQFMAYEQLKAYRQAQDSGSEFSAVDYLVLSCTAKVFAGSITYPYQVMRARLQMYEAGKNYEGLRDVILQTWRTEGALGFYRGLGPNLLRVLPSTGVTFIAYEETRKSLAKLSSG